MDPLFPQPEGFANARRLSTGEIFLENKYQLVFDEAVDSPQLKPYLSQCHESSMKIEEANEEKEDSDSDSDENKALCVA